MRPERNSRTVLSTTRSTAKMHEFRVAEADFIAGRDPTPLFSLAVGILGDVAATIARAPLGHWEALAAPELRPAAWDHDLPVAEALRFTSNFFDAFLNARLDKELTAEFSLLCACSYYLGGNVGSAVVIVRHMNLPDLDIAGGLGRMVHRILRGDHGPIEGPYDLRELVEPILAALDRFFGLEGEAADVVERCSELRKASYASGDARLVLYSDLVAALCHRKIENASRTILPPASTLDLEAWRPALARPAFPTELWPAQQRLAEAGLLRGRSAVIQMPTSAGKTRATELIIRAAFLSDRASLAVIVAPYRSLCHDIRGDLAAAFADDAIAIDEASDSFQFDLELDELVARDTVLIVTPEKLLYMLRRAPELADEIGLIIYDEGHQFDGMARGPTYELLLTSLRMKLKAGTQSVLISAVIGNADEIAGWLIGDRDAVIGGEGLLPTTKSIAFASWQDARGRLEYVSPTDPDEREYFVPRIITSTALGLKPRERTPRTFPEKDAGDIGLFLGLHLVGNGSVAIFCGRKDSVTKLSRRVLEIYDRGLGVPRPVDVSDQDEIGKLAFLANLHLGEAAATQATRMGVLSHHAATPHGLRLAIEHAMKRGHARFVVCTSTLAQGVNFPIRYLVISTTQQGAESIMVRDFHNLMGRAGRAGMHTEGSVIFSSPAIFDERGPQKDGWKWQAAKHLLDAANSEPSLSGLLKLFQPFEQRGAAPVVQPMLAQWLDLAFADQLRIDEIVAEALVVQPLISAAQFRPFIEERAHAIQQIAAFLAANMDFDDPAADDRVQELATHTLGYFLAGDDARRALIETFRMIAASIKAHADIDLRSIIRRSPLPPSVAAALQAWVAANLDVMNEANLNGTLLDVVAAAVLPHASDRSIRSMSNKAALPRLLTAWAEGRNYEHLLEILEEDPAIRISGRKPTVEDAVSIGDGGFGYDVAMLVAAITDLVEPIDGNLHSALGYLQKRVKYGLTLMSAIAMHEAGFADRVVATVLGTIWPLALDRAGVRAACRAPNSGMAAALQAFPEYFSTVADELRR